MLAALALLRAQAVDPIVVTQIVVTTAPSMDAQRLADALRVYLDEFGIRVETRAAGEADDLRKRIDDARQLGEALRAVAVVRAEHGARGTVEIELVDLATDKVLVVSVPRPERDEDLYRALALKIEAVLRATLSEARAELDPQSSLGRLVAESPRPPPAPAPVPAAPPALALDAGYGFVSFPDGGPSFGGLAVRGGVAPAPQPGARARHGGARIGARVGRHGRGDRDDRPGARDGAAVVHRRTRPGPGRSVPRRHVHRDIGLEHDDARPLRAQHHGRRGRGGGGSRRDPDVCLAVRAGGRVGRLQRRALRHRRHAAVRHVAPCRVGNGGSGHRAAMMRGEGRALPDAEHRGRFGTLPGFRLNFC